MLNPEHLWAVQERSLTHYAFDPPQVMTWTQEPVQNHRSFPSPRGLRGMLLLDHFILAHSPGQSREKITQKQVYYGTIFPLTAKDTRRGTGLPEPNWACFWISIQALALTSVISYFSAAMIEHHDHRQFIEGRVYFGLWSQWNNGGSGLATVS